MLTPAPVADSRRLCHELAALARVSLSESDAEAFAGQLERILDYVRQLQAIDVSGVPEFSPLADETSALRDDAPGPTLSVEDALASAASVRDGHFAVPRFKD